MRQNWGPSNYLPFVGGDGCTNTCVQNVFVCFKDKWSSQSASQRQAVQPCQILPRVKIKFLLVLLLVFLSVVLDFFRLFHFWCFCFSVFSVFCCQSWVVYRISFHQPISILPKRRLLQSSLINILTATKLFFDNSVVYYQFYRLAKEFLSVNFEAVAHKKFVCIGRFQPLMPISSWL